MRPTHEQHKSDVCLSAAKSMQMARGRSQPSRLALPVSCRHRRNLYLPATGRVRAAVTVTKQYNIVSAKLMLT